MRLDHSQAIRHDEQIIRKLREAERLLATSKDVEEVCRSLEISVQTYQRWKTQYQAMRPEEVALKGTQTVGRAHEQALS